MTINESIERLKKYQKINIILTHFSAILNIFFMEWFFAVVYRIILACCRKHREEYGNFSFFLSSHARKKNDTKIWRIWYHYKASWSKKNGRSYRNSKRQRNLIHQSDYEQDKSYKIIYPRQKGKRQKQKKKN